jgi:hypothetical protein
VGSDQGFLARPRGRCWVQASDITCFVRTRAYTVMERAVYVSRFDLNYFYKQACASIDYPASQ